MNGKPMLPTIATVGRPRRLTFRLRLALTYAALLTVSGALLLTLMTIVIVWIPDYTFAQAPTIPGFSEAPTDTPSPSETAISDNLSSAPMQVVVSSRDDLMRLFLVVGGVLLLVIALLGGAIGWKIAGRMLRPLHEVSVAAKHAANGRLDHRIGLGTPHDEITELATTFDDMLSSLETAFHSHQRFAANASHELRTPLATTRAVIDVALASGSTPRREVLAGLREMNERSLETVDALLALADIESAPRRARTHCDIALITRASADELAERAAERGVTTSLDLEPGAIAGDPLLLRLLADNLLSNAIRHNVKEGFITVRTRTEQGRAILHIANSGLTITPEQALQMTEPFVRIQGRAGSDHGHGLGLAIVAAIARQHSAQLQLDPREGGGLQVTVSFPTRTPPASRP
ncbi:Sensor protein [Microbacterium sp. C448]|uniref:sensor histidine kinase n=1 Tax=Microbacterium sp. C448 TaxID=1177594 RepID=UPI0003DE522C|nr:HAMP domain-containing sensor histidine kinase [Microbacterium sp. C448]CDK01608.1 Sensor protein [Microbacterium sp. C448]